MCMGCYEEYGSPRVITPTTKKAAKFIGKVFELSAVGGNCHVVIDDWNLEDEYIDACLGLVEEETDLEIRLVERKCLEFLKALSVDERASALALYDGFIS